jgi:hypothetical protein
MSPDQARHAASGATGDWQAASAGARIPTARVVLARHALRVAMAWRAALAQELTAGTRLRARLDDSVSALASGQGDSPHARVVAVDASGGAAVAAPRTNVMAAVRDMRRGDHGGARPVLALDFVGIHAEIGMLAPIHARVAEVHDARESLDTAGHVPRLPPAMSARSRRLRAFMLLASTHPAAAVVLFAALDGLALGCRFRAAAVAPTEARRSGYCGASCAPDCA